MTTVGTGNYRYRLIQDWATLPEGQTFGILSTVASDSQDRVYAIQRKDPPVLVFGRDGRLEGSWGNGAFASPHGLSIKNDIVYTTDRDDSVCLLYTLDGRPLQVLGRRGAHSDTGTERAGALAARAAGPFNYPTEMVRSPSGDLYVSDGYRNSRVHRFKDDGSLVHSWGEPGKDKPGQFHLPHSVFVDTGNVYVADRENCRVQVFTLDGKHGDTWQVGHRPQDIAADGDGTLYINTGGHPARMAQSEGHAGSPPQVVIMTPGGTELARFNHRLTTHGLWADSQGNIYVVITGLIEGAAAIDKYVRL